MEQVKEIRMKRLEQYRVFVLDLIGESSEQGTSPFIDNGRNRISLEKAVDALLASLPSGEIPDMRQVLEYYYGLNDGRRIGIPEIAEHFGLIGDQIQQLKGEALRLLHENPETEKLRQFTGHFLTPREKNPSKKGVFPVPLYINADQRALEQAFDLLKKRLQEECSNITGVNRTESILFGLGISGLSELRSAVKLGALLKMNGIGPRRIRICQEVLAIAQKTKEPKAL